MLQEAAAVQPFLQPNKREPWRSLAQPAHEVAFYQRAERPRSGSGALWDNAWTVFKTVARPASWSRVGSTPMHLRQLVLNSESRHPFYALDASEGMLRVPRYVHAG